ncbi:serine/threonine-protein kinase [Streptomonospora nanhaiensis]|uniref:serine/threonine-protein kinase n=1 Tax=Streptomonospora nanhaiensis TaxID=1323731 RepID=UPI001C38728D|nr:serine/threonine-protein kinase [Streptomonospora nanhaiensis]MBV2362863.1 serine/threonine protein kinase [Streptomonospora nanhaiensis]
MALDSGEDSRTVAGRYLLQRELGRGGMGVVWQALDTGLQRTVAVKEVLLPGHLTDAERADAHARVRREAQTAARVAHPSVITIHDVFDFEGHPWVVMELIRGRSLQEEIARTGPLPPERAATVAEALLEAVRAAHANGVVHRDIKPGNVMIGEHDRVVLTDFGIATMEGGASITRTGALVGSPEYMSPERLRSEQATPAADLWSVGVTLYTALNGESPFRRDSITAAIAAVLSAPLPPLPVAGPLAPLVAGLLERDPAARLTADAALELLRGPGAGRGAAGPSGPAGSATGPRTGAWAAGAAPADGTGRLGGHPSGPHTPPGPHTPFPGPHTPRPGAPGGFDTPHPSGPHAAPFGPTTPRPYGGPATPPHPPAPPPPTYSGQGPATLRDARRRDGAGVPVFIVAGALILVVVLVVAVVLVTRDWTRYETFRSSWYTVDYPAEWSVDDTAVRDDAYVRFEPDGDHLLYVDGWVNGPSDPDTSYGWIEADHREFQEDPKVSDYQALEMTEVEGGGFPADWDVARWRAEFSHEDWPTPRRYFATHLVTVGEETYAVTINVPADHRDDYADVYQRAVETFAPR